MTRSAVENECGTVDHSRPKGPADAHYHCFACGADTSENALARCDEQQSCIIECEYSLVHCTGPKYTFDADGVPVICAGCVQKALLQHNPTCKTCTVCGEEHVR